MAGISPLAVASMGANMVSGASGLYALTSAGNAKQNTNTQAYENRVAELNAQAAAEERKRKQSLDRVTAQQRARFASQGISTTEGSSAAVLDGLKTLSQAEAEDRARQVGLAHKRAELSLSNGYSSNLLEKKTSLVQDNLGKLLNWG